MMDQASQQQAILGVALAEGRFGPGALTALTTAQAQQASDLASFRDSAIPQESWALTKTLASPPARQAQAVEQRAIAASNGGLALGPQASQQWSAGMSYTVGWMGHAEQELAAWIPVYAQALQRSAMRSAIVTGGTGLGTLALVLLGSVLAARSMLPWRRRLEPAAPEGAGAPLPSSAGTPAASLFEMDQLATQIWRNSDSAVILADHETPCPAEPLALVEALRAAASEIEEHGRVILDVQQGVCVSGSAATDTVHLFAELLENATTFSPETARVIVSGYALYGGGSLIAITDGGTGMSEEELTLLNRQLANPSLTDMAAARHMGLFTVALLAARHGITVTLSMPPDGGTTAEVYLPAALISLDAGPDGLRGRAGEAPLAGTSAETAARVTDLPLPARRFASEPAPPLGPETAAPEAVPLMLGAPVPSPAPATSTGMTEPEPVGAEPGDGTPIFESVRSGYLYAFGRDPLPFSEKQAGQSPTGRPAKPPTSPDGGNSRAVARPPTAGRPASFGRPQRVPQPGWTRGTAVDQETRQASAAESAELTRSKLASFQRGSRQARTVARPDRSARQPGQDG
jgi:signal transduction histidine kinase